MGSHVVQTRCRFQNSASAAVVDFPVTFLKAVSNEEPLPTASRIRPPADSPCEAPKPLFELQAGTAAGIFAYD